MAIKVKFGSATDESGQTDEQIAARPGIKVRLDIRKALGGDLIISDHPDIDIVIMPGKNKILALPKKLLPNTCFCESVTSTCLGISLASVVAR